MKFWRFTRGVPGLYKHIILSYSPTGQLGSYVQVATFNHSFDEAQTVTPYFDVTGATGTSAHPSTVFDNYNVPCVP